MTRFSSLRTRSPRLPILSAPGLRIAQLSTATSVAGAEPFPPERWSNLKTYAPNVLVGPSSVLQRLAERIDMHTLELTSVDHAILVLTEIGDKPLSDTTRVILWQHFGVPVYELYGDSKGALLAAECEAQDGWHVELGVRFFVQAGDLFLQSSPHKSIRTGLRHFLDESPCACGKSGLRLIDPDLCQLEDTEPLLAAIA